MDILKEVMPMILSALSLIGVIYTLKFNDASSIRKEMNGRCEKQDQKIEALTAELDSWKSKYYILANEYLRLKNKYMAMGIQLNDIKNRFLNKDNWDKYGFTDDDEDPNSG